MIVALIILVTTFHLFGIVVISIWTIFLFSILFAALILLIVAFFADRSNRLNDLSLIAQGVGSIITCVALFVAGGLYFLERRDQPTLIVGVEAQAYQLASSPAHSRQVMLAIRSTIRNPGIHQTDVRCISLEIEGHFRGEVLSRDARRDNLMGFERLPQRLAIRHNSGRACLQADAATKRIGISAIRPLYMWRPLILEPGEEDYHLFEIPVDCRYDILRITVSARSNPEDTWELDSERLISLSDACGRPNV